MTADFPPFTVALDCDGLLSDFVGGVLRHASHFTNENFDREQFADWDIFDPLDAARPGLKKKLYEVIVKPGFCRLLDPLPGAVEALRRLTALEDQGKIELLIVTSPWDSSPTWMHERTAWLVQHGVKRAHVIHAAVKHRVAADIFMDDKPSHVDRWNASNPYGYGLLWRTPHNLSANSGHHVVTEWSEFFDFMTDIGGIGLGPLVRVELDLMSRGVSRQDHADVASVAVASPRSEVT